MSHALWWLKKDFRLADNPAPISDRLAKAFKDDFYAINRLPETWKPNAPLTSKLKRAKLPKPAPLFDTDERADA